MLTRFALTSLLFFGLLLGAAHAEDKVPEPKPKPDFCPVSIRLPEKGLSMGANQLTLTIENRAKESDAEGKIKYELVVLSADNSRQSYFGEVDAMRYGQKKDVVIDGVQVNTQENVRFLVILDPENVSEESNEDNNRYIYQAKIKAPESEKLDTEVPEVEKPETGAPEVEKAEIQTPDVEETGTDAPQVEKTETESPEVEKLETDSPELEKDTEES